MFNLGVLHLRPDSTVCALLIQNNVMFHKISNAAANFQLRPLHFIQPSLNTAIETRVTFVRYCSVVGSALA